MEVLIIVVFAACYLGMAAGQVPGLRLDRAGIAVVAAAILLVAGAVTVPRAAKAVDLPTILLLFSLMIVSAQLGVAGFHEWVAARLARVGGSPARLMALVVVVGGGLSALLANDVIVFAMAPILAEGTRRRGLDPRPFLLALAGAANAGSAMTVIGNPQNILIGQVGHLGFWSYLAIAAPPGLAGMAVTFAVVLFCWRRDLHGVSTVGAQVVAPHPLDRYQAIKGLVATLVLVALFTTGLSRELAALGVAAVLLVSRKTASADLLRAVDWPLLVLFTCLFVITAAFGSLGLAAQAADWLGRHGVLPDHLAAMAPILLALSNTIGNVPAVILILQAWPNPPQGAMAAMAIFSTLAGNLLLTGSLANIIVAERARLAGVRLTFADFARAGIPMTVISMVIAVAWLAAIGALPWSE